DPTYALVIFVRNIGVALAVASDSAGIVKGCTQGRAAVAGESGSVVNAPESEHPSGGSHPADELIVVIRKEQVPIRIGGHIALIDRVPKGRPVSGVTARAITRHRLNESGLSDDLADTAG